MSPHRKRARREKRNAIAFTAEVNALVEGAPSSRAFAELAQKNIPWDQYVIERVR